MRMGYRISLGLSVLLVASTASLDLQLAKFFSVAAMQRIGRFLAELLDPNFEWVFVTKVAFASVETLAMSALGTFLAAVFGLALAVPASKMHIKDAARFKPLARGVLNVLRSVPELVWAALLLIAAGLGPFPGTLALALHTTGVLGRLFAESIENAEPGPGEALRNRGISEGMIFWYATFVQVLPQLLSYTLYRWENNIRAAAILGVVGAGGLGQMLSFHMGLFQMSETCTVLVAMIIMVSVVDSLSYWARTRMGR